jgi:DNA-directed RNA polymerase subunit RPC12/RpoP
MNTALAVERTTSTLCVDCGKPWSMPERDRDWWLKQIETKPEIKMPLRCWSCRRNSKVTGPGCLMSSGQVKIRYELLEEAEYVEERHRVDRKFNRQYAYKCPDCSGFHLTSKPPNDLKPPQVSQMRYDNLYAKPKAIHGLEGETREKVRELAKSGLGGVDIAKRLGRTPSNTYYQLRIINDPIPLPVSSSTKRTTKSLSDIASTRLKLPSTTPPRSS